MKLPQILVECVRLLDTTRRDGNAKVCMYCHHRYPHTPEDCKQDNRHCCGSKEAAVYECEIVTVFEKCRNCAYFGFDGGAIFKCLLTKRSPSEACPKGKTTVDDLVVILNRILPYVFATSSQDVSNVGSASITYPDHTIDCSSFLNIKS